MSQNQFINLSRAELIEHAIKNGEGQLTDTGALAVNTKKYTGRSPSDKFTVCDDLSKDVIWYHDGNQRMTPASAEKLFLAVEKYLSDHKTYVLDCQAAASDEHAMKI